NGSIAWGDYDSDGNLDLLISGLSNSGNYITQIWRNNQGVFSDIQAGLPGVVDRNVAWGDYDNDGDLDLVICGFAGFSGPLTGYITQIWRNDHGIFHNAGANLPVLNFPRVSWVDFDNDGDLDLLIQGIVQ